METREDWASEGKTGALTDRAAVARRAAGRRMRDMVEGQLKGNPNTARLLVLRKELELVDLKLLEFVVSQKEERWKG